MSKEEFLELLMQTIDCEEISEDMKLEEIDEYDSVAVLSLMSMYDELGIKVLPKDFENLETVKDLILLAGEKIE
jgi:acyl carrier protein